MFLLSFANAGINSNSPEEKKKEVFEQLVKFYPEVLDSWFKRKFSNPQIW